MHTLLTNLHRRHFGYTPEQPTNPPDPEPDPQITREDYEYHTPDERDAVAAELITTLEECANSIDFLNRSDPEAGENFPGAKMVIAALINKVREHRAKVEPWLEVKDE